MYAAAYVVTASILGVAGDKVAGVPPIWALLIGVGGASLPVGLAAWFGRKKNDGDLAAALVKAASELNNDYRQHDAEMEARLVKAEQALGIALIGEAACQHRLSELEAKVAALGTTTTVSVSHQ